MNAKKIADLAVAALVLNLTILTDANAAVDTTCDASSNRSKISVDGSRLGVGIYRASVQSPAINSARIFSKNYLRPVRGEVEFDFDSNLNDVLKGATRIPAKYIKNNRVVGSLWKLNANNTLSLVGRWAETCVRR